jgi:hypothetical protein
VGGASLCLYACLVDDKAIAKAKSQRAKQVTAAGPAAAVAAAAAAAKAKKNGSSSPAAAAADAAWDEDEDAAAFAAASRSALVVRRRQFVQLSVDESVLRWGIDDPLRRAIAHTAGKDATLPVADIAGIVWGYTCDAQRAAAEADAAFDRSEALQSDKVSSAIAIGSTTQEQAAASALARYANSDLEEASNGGGLGPGSGADDEASSATEARHQVDPEAVCFGVKIRGQSAKSIPTPAGSGNVLPFAARSRAEAVRWVAALETLSGTVAMPPGAGSFAALRWVA